MPILRFLLTSTDNYIPRRQSKIRSYLIYDPNRDITDLLYPDSDSQAQIRIFLPNKNEIFRWNEAAGYDFPTQETVNLPVYD